jgi:hypothetical protein
VTEHPERRANSRRSLVHRALWLGLCGFLLFSVSSPLWGQSKKDPLNDQEVDQVREVADQPIERVKLYMKFISQRVDAIQEMGGDTKINNGPQKLHNLLEEYTRLVDELQDNLDTYDETHSDVRKALKELVPASEKWVAVLNKPPPDQSYDFSRKTAVEAGQSLAEQAKKLQADQIKWFAEHKHDKDNGDTPPPPK